MQAKLHIVLCACAALALASIAIAQPTIGSLVSDLAGPDDHDRVVARQLLPREGMDALPALIPLLDRKEPHIAKAAYTVIWDILNEAARPGLETDRARATDLLMALLLDEKSAEIRTTALKLLAIAVPEGYDVGPIARLLQDAELREEARTTLERIATPQACAALRVAIGDADPQFACVLLNALGHLKDAESLPSICKLAGHTEPRVRAAAARALAWTGDPRLAEVVCRVRDESTPDTAFEATVAVLELAEAMAETGRDWNRAIALYRNVLDTAPFGALQAAAMAGLGKYGDETVMDAMIAAAQGGSSRLEQTIIPAFELLQGRAAAKRMVAAYPEFSREARLALVGMFGRRRDPLLLPVLIEAAHSDDSAFRIAGIRALATAGLAEGMDALVVVARSGGQEEKSMAVRAARQVADALRASGDRNAAGTAYLGLYKMAPDDTARLEALAGLTQCPVPDAFEALMAAVDEPVLKDAALEALIPLAETLMAAGHGEKALKAYETVGKLDPSVETVGRIAGRMRELGADMNPAEHLGFITRWWLAGPFDWNAESDWENAFVGEPDVDLEATFTDGDQPRSWSPYETPDPMGIVDLTSAVAPDETCFAYAYAEIVAEQATDAVCRIGTDDGELLWFNGELVLDNRVDRPLSLDQDKVNVKLKAGVNRVLLKISQRHGGWAFCLRITTAQGLGAPFTQADR